MMLIVMHEDPIQAARLLIENTSNQFCFKQLIELGQLICSAGISSVYKKIPQGREIQEWIRENPGWVYHFLTHLNCYCSAKLSLSPETIHKLSTIIGNLVTFWATVSPESSAVTHERCKTAIWRYKKSYISKYPTNSELPIETTTRLYVGYITKFKFPRKITDIYK